MLSFLVSSYSFSGPYIGVNLGSTKYEMNHAYKVDNMDKTYGTSGSYSAVGIKLGYEFNPYLSFEGRYTNNNSLNTYHVPKHQFGLLAKISLPVSERVALYGLAGTSVFDAPIYNSSRPSNGTDVFPHTHKVQTTLALGGGVEFRHSENVAFNMEYVNYAHKDAYKFGGVNIGLNYYF
ncbi:porin family protein [Vibrio nomapromontoriensis]